jgi:uncharacterized protein YjbI with pentapeptide repeats
VFQGYADFSSAAFQGYAGFRRAAFQGDAYFRSAAFQGDAYFSSAAFQGYADFSSAAFQGYADFSSAKFKNGMDLRETAFESESIFRQAVIRRATKSTRNNYYGGFDVNMTNCSFARLGDFTGCTIVGHVLWAWPGHGDKWSRAEPEKLKPHATLEFDRMKLSDQAVEIPKGDLRFEEMTLAKSRNKIPRGTLLFESLKFEEYNQDDIREQPILDLRKNELADDVHLKIHDCQMEHILLEGTDCTQISFYNNKWPDKHGRTVVGDEYHIGNLPDYNPQPALIRRTYQQLARRFHEDLDHPRATEFDRGAFEMRRQETMAKGEERDLTTHWGLTLYKLVSDYSGSLLRPVLWLAASILLFGWFYSVCVGEREWTLWPLSVDWNYMGEFYKDTLKVIAFGKPEVTELKNAGFWLNLLMLIQRVLTATLITLFIFAVRRRFKH